MRIVDEPPEEIPAHAVALLNQQGAVAGEKLGAVDAEAVGHEGERHQAGGRDPEQVGIEGISAIVRAADRAHAESSLAEDGPFAAAMSRSRRSISRLIVSRSMSSMLPVRGGLGGGLAPGFDARSEQRLVGAQADAEIVSLACQPEHVVGGDEQDPVGPVVDLRPVVPLQFGAADA